LLRRDTDTMGVVKGKAAASRRVMLGVRELAPALAQLAAARYGHDGRGERQGGGKPPHSK
jgi:hypothetical protein